MVKTRGSCIQSKDALRSPLVGVSKKSKNVSISIIPPDNVNNREIVTPDPDLPNITVVDRNRTEKLNFKMEFLATRTNGELSLSADPVEVPFSLADMKWKLIVAKDSGKYIDITLLLFTKISANHWKLSVAPSFQLSRTEEDGRVCKSNNIAYETGVYDHQYSSRYWCQMPSSRWSSVVPIPQVGEESIRTVVDVEFVIAIKEMFGFRCRSFFSYDFTQPNKDSDLLFKFGDGDVFINCTLLSFHSPYFAATKDRLSAMKRDEKGFPFEEMVGEREEFIELMQMVYPSSHKVTDENVAFILPLADRFLFDGVLRECEKFLMTEKSERDTVLKLHWSSLYSMNELQHWCMSEFKTREAISKVEESKYFPQLSAKVLSLLFQKVLRL